MTQGFADMVVIYVRIDYVYHVRQFEFKCNLDLPYNVVWWLLRFTQYVPIMRYFGKLILCY
jgi:hypothetical protein